MFKKYSIVLSFLFIFVLSAPHAEAFSFKNFFGNIFNKAPAVQEAPATPLGANAYDTTIQKQPEVIVNPTITKPTTSSTTTIKPAVDTTPTTSICTITSFIASPSQIKFGATTKISWTTEGCTSVTINDRNYKTNGSLVTESLTATKKFTIFATGLTEKKLIAKALTVTVSEQESNIVMGGTECAINSFTASPASITSGGYSTLSWSTTSCTSVKIGDVTYGTVGTLKVGPLTASKTYTLTAYGEGGTVTRTTTVMVTNTQTACMLKSFTADPTTVNSGGTSTLSWNTTGCTAITLSLDGSNDYPISGSASTGPLTATKTYTLSGTGSNGIQTKTVTVTVLAPTCTINSFTANPVTINSGGTATLAWSTTGCGTATVNQNNALGVVSTLLNSTNISVQPTATTVYTLYTNLPAGCTTTSGYSSTTGMSCSTTSPTKSVTVTVNPVVSTCVIDSFTASPNPVVSGGSTTLSWTTTGCVTVDIAGIMSNCDAWDRGSDSIVDGSAVYGPLTSQICTSNNTLNSTYTYFLSGYDGKGGPLTKKTITVNVTPKTQIGCTIDSFTAEVAGAYVYYSNYHDLFWATTDCTTVTINGISKPVDGSVIASGTTAIWPVDEPCGTATYTLIANGGVRGTQTKSVSMYYPCLKSAPSITTPAEQTVAPGTPNVNIGDFDLTLSANVTPQSAGNFFVQGSCFFSGSKNIFKDMRFMVGGIQVAVLSSSKPCVDGHWYDPVTISNPIPFVANETKKVSVYVDIDPLAPIGGRFVLTLSGSLMTAYSAGQGSTANATMVGLATNNCTINSFTANPTSVNSGSSSTLSWSTTGCIIAGLGSSMVVTNGTSNTGALTQTTIYTLYAGTALPVGCPSFAGYSLTTGLPCNTGAQSKTVTVTVNPIIVTRACAISSFTLPTTMSASASSIVMTGLATSNCTNVWAEINSGYSTRRYEVLPMNGSYTFANTPSTGTSDTSLDVTIFASNSGNITSQTKSITISPVTHAASNQCPVTSFTVSPNPATTGSSVTLSWNTPAGCMVFLEKVTSSGNFSSIPGFYPAVGTKTDIISGPTTYYLTAQAGYVSQYDNTSVLGAKTVDVNIK